MVQVMGWVTLQAVQLEAPAVEGYARLLAIVGIAVGTCRDLNERRVTMMYLIPNMTVKMPMEMKRKMRSIESRLQWISSVIY